MTANRSVFIYLEGSYDRVSSLIELAQSYHYQCFTHDNNYKKHCETKGVKCNLVLRGRHLKKELTKLNPSVIILRNDSYYGENFWMAKQYKTVVIEEGFEARQIEEMQNLTNILYENSSFLKKISLPLFKILSLAPVHPKLKSFTPYNIISRSIFKTIFDRFYFGMKNRSMFPGIFSNKYCVSHEQNKEVYNFFGIDENKMEVTGLPMFDTIPTLIHKWNDRGKVIQHDLLYIGQPWSQSGVENFYDLLFPKLISLAKNYSLCVKLHPRESMQDYKYLEDYPYIKIIPHSPSFSLEDNLKLILESKYIIGTVSSLISFSILLDKPVIIYNFLFPDTKTQYEMLGLKFCTTSFDGLLRAIQDCEEKNERYYEQMNAQQEIKNMVVIDGKACERINKVIESVKSL